jgi:hypothetical protein
LQQVGEMMSSEVAQVLEQVSHWPREDRLELTRSLDKLAAMERLEAIAQKVAERAAMHPMTEQEIDHEVDEAVAEVRRERPLHQRQLAQGA